MCTAERERERKKMIDLNVRYKNPKRHTVYNQDTRVQLIILFIGQLSGVFTQLMGVPDKCYVLIIFTNILVVESSLRGGTDEISARLSPFGLISTGYKMTDRSSTGSMCV